MNQHLIIWLVATDQGFCYPLIYGCTDPAAFNYNDLRDDIFPRSLTG